MKLVNDSTVIIVTRLLHYIMGHNLEVAKPISREPSSIDLNLTIDNPLVTQTQTFENT